jgi:hypothetical protein
MGWIENAAERMAGKWILNSSDIATIIRDEYEKEFPPNPVPVPSFVALSNPNCGWCNSSNVRNSSMRPTFWVCNDCGKHTEQ